MSIPVTLPPEPLSKVDIWRLDLNLCADAFRIGRLSEAGLRHHLARLGFAAHEIEVEVEWHRVGLKSERRAA
jgi:hypothetical protein